MGYNSSDIILVNLLKQAVESKGCHLTEVDFEHSLINKNSDTLSRSSWVFSILKTEKLSVRIVIFFFYIIDEQKEERQKKTLK